MHFTRLILVCNAEINSILPSFSFPGFVFFLLPFSWLSLPVVPVYPPCLALLNLSQQIFAIGRFFRYVEWNAFLVIIIAGVCLFLTRLWESSYDWSYIFNSVWKIDPVRCHFSCPQSTSIRMFVSNMRGGWREGHPGAAGPFTSCLVNEDVHKMRTSIATRPLPLDDCGYSSCSIIL